MPRIFINHDSLFGDVLNWGDAFLHKNKQEEVIDVEFRVIEKEEVKTVKSYMVSSIEERDKLTNLTTGDIAHICEIKEDPNILIRSAYVYTGDDWHIVEPPKKYKQNNVDGQMTLIVDSIEEMNNLNSIEGDLVIYKDNTYIFMNNTWLKLKGDK